MQAYLADIRKTISQDRFFSYHRSGDRDDLDVLARYFWNALLCEALYPAMHAFEVALRNTLYSAVESVYPAASADCVDIQTWLDFKVPIVHPGEAYRVPEAKERLRRGNKQLTLGRLIAELNLNFWRKLLHKPYGTHSKHAPGDFWPRLVPVAFPHADRKFQNISRISDTVDSIYEMRNRMFHQEPIFDGVLARHGKLMRAIGWMEPRLEATVRELDRFPETFTLQPEGLRDRLERVAQSGDDQRARWAARESLVRTAKAVLGTVVDPEDGSTHDLRDLAKAVLDIGRRPVPPRWVLRMMRQRIDEYQATAPAEAPLAATTRKLRSAIDGFLALDDRPGSEITAEPTTAPGAQPSLAANST